jgi:hypothetical protein
MIIDGTSGVTFPNSTVQASAGSVLQVVSTTATSGFVGTTSSSYVTSNFSASITPKFSTSKISIFANFVGQNTSNGQLLHVTVYRGGSNIGQAAGMIQSGGPAGIWIPMALSCQDSPATTSSTTYTLYFKVDSGTGYVGGDTGNNITITLFEVAQ